MGKSTVIGSASECQLVTSFVGIVTDVFGTDSPTTGSPFSLTSVTQTFPEPSPRYGLRYSSRGFS